MPFLVKTDKIQLTNTPTCFVKTDIQIKYYPPYLAIYPPPPGPHK